MCVPAAAALRADRLLRSMGRDLCAVRAFGALCAECGPAGKEYSKSLGYGPPPAFPSDPLRCCEGATTKRTAETFIEMFGSNGLTQDAARRSNPWNSAGQKLHLRAADVKRAVLSGVFSMQQLHAKLSWAAWNASVLRGTTLVHSTDGPCAACQIFCPDEYAALTPQLGRPGPPSKGSKRKSGAQRVVSMSSMRASAVVHAFGSSKIHTSHTNLNLNSTPMLLPQ